MGLSCWEGCFEGSEWWFENEDLHTTVIRHNAQVGIGALHCVEIREPHHQHLSPRSEPFVFLSCTDRDKCKPLFARPTQWFLTEKLGIQVFLDETNIPWGEPIPKALVEAAYTCTHAMVILSPHFRHRRYCVQELNTFMERWARKDSSQTQQGALGFTLLPALWKVKDVNGYAKRLNELSFERAGDDSAVTFLTMVLWKKLADLFPPKKGSPFTQDDLFHALEEYVAQSKRKGIRLRDMPLVYRRWAASTKRPKSCFVERRVEQDRRQQDNDWKGIWRRYLLMGLLFLATVMVMNRSILTSTAATEIKSEPISPWAWRELPVFRLPEPSPYRPAISMARDGKTLVLKQRDSYANYTKGRTWILKRQHGQETVQNWTLLSTNTLVSGKRDKEERKCSDWDFNRGVGEVVVSGYGTVIMSQRDRHTLQFKEISMDGSLKNRSDISLLNASMEIYDFDINADSTVVAVAVLPARKTNYLGDDIYSIEVRWEGNETITNSSSYSCDKVNATKLKEVQVFKYNAAEDRWATHGDISLEDFPDGYFVRLSDSGNIMVLAVDNYYPSYGETSKHLTIRAYRRNPTKPAWYPLGQAVDLRKGVKYFVLSGDGYTFVASAGWSWGYAGQVQAYRYNKRRRVWEPFGSREILTNGDLNERGSAIDLSYDGNTMVVSFLDAQTVDVYRYDPALSDWILLGDTIHGGHVDKTCGFGRYVQISEGGTLLAVSEDQRRCNGTAATVRTFELIPAK